MPASLGLLLFALACAATELVLSWLNLAHARRHAGEVPREFAGEFDQATLARMFAYTVDRSRVAMAATLFTRVLVIGVFFSGALGAYDRWVAGVSGSFIGKGVVFFLGVAAASALVGLPFGVYRTFVIEARHGFNRTTLRTFLLDLSKGMLLSGVLLAVATAAALWVVERLPTLWWLLVWTLFLVLGLVLTLIAPRVIEPLFFKIEPLALPELEREVQALAERTGVHVSRVLQMDASKRSSHSNAYFTGLGPVKRVVLFDTLLSRMNHREILGVLAHELGHWKLGHVLQRFVIDQLLTLAICYTAFRLIPSSALPHWIGESDGSFYLRVCVLFFVGSLLGFIVTPLASYWSRRHERQADRFASELTGEPEALASGLTKLSRDNLSNLHPHPWYAAFYASHPILTERVRHLTSLARRDAPRAYS